MKVLIEGKTREIAELFTIPKGSIRNYDGCQGVSCKCTSDEKTISTPIYGVKGLNSLYPNLTRTDDAVGMNYSIDYETGEVHSDFDNVFPWNETEIIEYKSGKFIKFPKMWFRVGSDSEYRITDVAVSKTPSVINNDKWFPVESFCISCYKGSLTKYKGKQVMVSWANEEILTNKTIDELRKLAKNNGNDYGILDLYHLTVLRFLWFIEFANKNSNFIMTGRINKSGKKEGCFKVNTGGTDNISTPSGFETDYAQMRWHYIEDFIGNTFDFIDGIICEDSGKHHKTSNGEKLCYTAAKEGYIKAFGWDDDHPFLCLPVDICGNYFQGFCNYNNVWGSGYPVLYCGSDYNNSNADCGLSYCYNSGATLAYDYFGSRLLKIL